jgi:hypothetical protein
MIPDTLPVHAAAYSVFQQGWWLDAVAPGQWGEIVLEDRGAIKARLPYVRRRRHGFTLLTMPPLTQTLGPWVSASSNKPAKQSSEQRQLLTELIDRLPRHDLFLQAFSPALMSHLPFYWSGFHATVRYTYRLEDLTNLDTVWGGLQRNIRRDICKAQKRVAVHTDLPFERLLDIVDRIYRRQGRTLPYSRALARRLDQACQAHHARRIFAAQDAQGRIHACLYLVWDANAAYSLIGGGDPDLRGSGAVSLLLWEAIQYASQVTAVFDFEGSMVRSIEQFFSAFGARQMPYLVVFRTSRRLRVLVAGLNLLRAFLGRDAAIVPF